jgi:hypothetical protein
MKEQAELRKEIEEEKKWMRLADVTTSLQRKVVQPLR